MPAGTARTGDLPVRRDRRDLHQRPGGTERGNQAGFGGRDVLVDPCRFIRPQNDTANLHKRAAAAGLVQMPFGDELVGAGEDVDIDEPAVVYPLHRVGGHHREVLHAVPTQPR